MRAERMHELLKDVECIIINGTLDGVSAFNQAQVTEERSKEEFIDRCPELEKTLHQLEDCEVLRGSLAAFELDEAVFSRRTLVFLAVFSDPKLWRSFAGALISIGDYSLKLNHRFFQFGTNANSAPWRELLTAGRTHIESARQVLGLLLDEVAAAGYDAARCLEMIQSRWLDACITNTTFDWRYYFVKYPCMRSGRSGLYVGSQGALGYSVCMRDKQQMNSWYRDPFILAICRESGVGDAVYDPWFTGYETQERWIKLVRSGIELRCVETGIELQVSHSVDEMPFANVCEKNGVNDVEGKKRLLVRQVNINGKSIDTQDRVQLAATLLRDLVEAGL